jgi:hypothetical protein
MVTLRRMAIEHMAEVQKLPHVWTPETPEQRGYLERLAQFVAHGRTAIAWQKLPFGNWKIGTVQTEEPFRALQQLRNLARALARVHGRTVLTEHELELVRLVALSSLPADRKAVLDLFRTYPNGMTSNQCAAGLKLSDDRARQRLQELARIGLVLAGESSVSQGRPPTCFAVAPQWADIVTMETGPIDHLLDLKSGVLSRQNSPQEKEPIIY